MRLKNMYLTCKKHIEFLSGEFWDKATKNDGQIIYYLITDYNKYVNTVNELFQIDALKSTIQALKECRGDDMRLCMSQIYSNKTSEFTKLLKELTTKMNTIIDLGNSVGFEDIKYGFDIKLPPNLQLKEMSQCISDIDKALTQCPLLRVDEERVEFKNVDVGSMWFEFLTICTGTTILLLNLGKVVDKAVQIASHLKMVRHQTEQCKSLGIKNELAENMSVGFKEMTNLLLEKCVNELQEEISVPALDNEGLERTKLTLNLFGEWMSKGMEIHSCIESPQEVKDLFPVQESQEALVRPIEMLANKE